jgi:hypothetical protein
MKTCTTCLKEKEVNRFWKNKTGRDRITSQCKLCLSYKQLDYYQLHKKKIILRQRERMYGITEQWYADTLSKQNGVCASCRRPERLKRNGVLLPLTIDHDHTTGVTRGLLCSHCNRAAGLLQEDFVLAARLALYLESAA